MDAGPVRNYAKSLFAEASEKKLQEKIYKEIKELGDLLDSDEGLKALITSPIFSSERKKLFLDYLNKKFKFSKISSNFFFILTKNSRWDALSEIIAAYFSLLREYRGEKEINFVSSKVLKETDKKYLTDLFSKRLGRKIEAVFKIDPSLIGGIRVEYDDYLLDCSMLRSLTKISGIMKK